MPLLAGLAEMMLSSLSVKPRHIPIFLHSCECGAKNPVILVMSCADNFSVEGDAAWSIIAKSMNKIYFAVFNFALAL